MVRLLWQKAHRLPKGDNVDSGRTIHVEAGFSFLDPDGRFEGPRVGS